MYGERGTIQIRMKKVLKAVITLDAFRNLYLMKSHTSKALTVASTETFTLWHRCLGQLSYSWLSKLQKMLEDTKCLPLTAEEENCKDCLLAKSTKLPTTGPESKT